MRFPNGGDLTLVVIAIALFVILMIGASPAEASPTESWVGVPVISSKDGHVQNIRMVLPVKYGKPIVCVKVPDWKKPSEEILDCVSIRNGVAHSWAFKPAEKL